METIVNKSARANYEFLDSWEAGIRLTGAEVKSVKHGNINLKASYCGFDNSELWLKNAHIAAYQRKNQPNYDPLRPRKILLTQKEITGLIGKLNEKGLTLIPEKVYSKGGLIKMTVVLVRGRKKFDKRQQMKKREIDRAIASALKNKKYSGENFS